VKQSFARAAIVTILLLSDSLARADNVVIESLRHGREQRCRRATRARTVGGGTGSRLLSKNPAADINNPKSIMFVMKGGQIIDDESQLPLAGGTQRRRFAL